MRGTCRTRSACITAGLLLPILSSAAALGQNWITFENQTAMRMVAEAGFPYNPASDNHLTDTQEKDYGVGDFDNDGDPDVVVVRKQPRTTQGKRKAYLFLNEQGVLINRTNEHAAQLLEPCNNRDVVVVDLDGDGWPDLVTAVTFPMAGDAPSVKMPRAYMNLGADDDGNWLGFAYNYTDQRIPDFPMDPFFCSVEAGDLDADGDADLFFVDYAADTSVPDPPGGPLKNRLMLNDGNGFFTDVTQTNVVESGASALLGAGFGARGKFADLDGDDDPDILAVDTCSANPRTMRFARNNGAAVFTATANLTVGFNAYDTDVGDVNQDDKIDFLEIDDSQDRIGVNTGNGGAGLPTFTFFLLAGQASSTTSGFGGSAYLRDLDDDGRLDAVICDENTDLAGGGNRMALFHGIDGLPWLSASGPENADPFVLGSTACTEPLCTRDTFDAAILDIDGNDKLDLVVGTDTGTKVFLQPPIIPAPPAVVATTPVSGTIDRLQDQAAGGELQGVDEVSFVFSQAVRDAETDGPVSPASFSTAITTSLAGLTPPVVVSVAPGPGNSYVLMFDRPITPGAWTTITANVESLDGIAAIAHALDLGFIPGDVSGQLSTNTQDLLAWLIGFRTCTLQANCSSPAVLAQLDIDRSGVPNTQDLLRLVQLLNGVNTQNPWNGVSLPPQP